MPNDFTILQSACNRTHDTNENSCGTDLANSLLASRHIETLHALPKRCGLPVHLGAGSMDCQQLKISLQVVLPMTHEISKFAVVRPQVSAMISKKNRKQANIASSINIIRPGSQDLTSPFDLFILCWFFSHNLGQKSAQSPWSHPRGHHPGSAPPHYIP